MVLIWFSPWWLFGKNLAPLDILNDMMQPWRGTSEQVSVKNHIVSDAVDQYLVYRMVAADSYAKEGWLGWSSLTYGGTAQYANTMALYYDWTMQLHRWLPFWTAWHLGILLQVMLAAIGMLLFLRGRSIRNLWACCGALAYAGNSQFVTWIYHRWTLGSFCWVPWILWAIDSYRAGKRNHAAWVPVFIAMAFLGGTLQHAAYVGLAVIAMWGEEAIRIGKSWASQARLFSRYFVWGFLGFCLAGMMFLPCIDAFLTSTKLGLHMGMHGTAAMGLYPRGLLQPLLNLAAYPLQFFPSILGRSETVDLLKLFRSELFYIAYFGSLPVLIALLAFFWKRTPPLARLLIGMGLILPLTPLLRLLYHRLYLLFILGGILAFVHFMETASEETRKRIFKVTAGLAGMAVTLWLLASVVLKLKADTVAALLYQKVVAPSAGSSFGYFRDWMQGRADKLMGDLFIWSPQQWIPLALFLVALLGFRLTAGQSSKLRARGSWMVAAAIVLEVSVFGARWITYVDPIQSPLFAATHESAVLQKEIGKGRLTTLIEESGSHMAVTPFIPNTLSPYGIATIGGYDSIMPNGMYLINDPRRDAMSLGRLGVSHMITYSGNPHVGSDWGKEIWKSPSMTIYRNPLAIPRYLGFRKLEDLERFFSGNPDPQWIELTESTQLENTREIPIAGDLAWVRIAENHAEGWQYRLSPATEWQPVLRADDASMLLSIPDANGARKIEMRYRPPLRIAGFVMSGSALLVTLFGAFGMRRGRWGEF